jgi:hypothetical protein
MLTPHLKNAKKPWRDDNNFLTSGTSISCQMDDKGLYVNKIVEKFR